MLRQFTGLCAALAFVAASPAAFAIKIFDTAPANRAAQMMGMDSFTYAAETLLSNAVTEVEGDSTKYYNIGGTEALILSAPADVGASADDVYVVTVTLDGMVFRAVPTLAGAGEVSVAAGGAIGEKMVVFRRTGMDVVDAATGMLHLSAMLAVSEGGGSATLTMKNQTLAGLGIEGVSGTATHSGNAIKVESALKEMPMANDLTASVVSSFKKFEGDMTVGHVGSLTIGFEGHRIATSNAGATGIVDGLHEILVTGQTAVGTTTTANSSVSFMGDFSFTEKVFVHGDGDCGAADAENPTEGVGTDVDLASVEMNIQMKEGTGDDAVVTGTTMPVNLDNTPGDDSDDLAAFTGYLCIMVQGDDTDDMDAPRIPDTGAYTAMASYEALDMAANGPMGMERMLGEINRDGTTVRIPFVTTYDGYNQRIVFVNRGGEVRYEIEFKPEEGTMADPMDMEGMLPVGTTMMRATDIVTLTGVSKRSAASIIIEAQPHTIDVATVTVNKSVGSTDTVIYTDN